MADPIGRDGPSILVRPGAEQASAILAEDSARGRAGAALTAGARVLDAALAELAIESVRNGLNTEFIFGLASPGMMPATDVSFYSHWVATISWLWVAAAT